MTQRIWLRVLMLGAFLFSFTLVGCSDDAGEDADAAEVDVEVTADEGGDFDAGEIKESMLELNEKMYEIISGIESVEDAKEAEEEIGEVFEQLAENLKAGMHNPEAMQTMEAEMAQDPKMQEWDQKIGAAIETLRSEHPEAAAELDRVMQTHQQKMQQAMMEAAQSMPPPTMPDAGAPSDAAPGDTPDTAAAGK